MIDCPCARCGTLEGLLSPSGRPGRIGGERFGFAGKLCANCYQTALRRYQAGKNAASPAVRPHVASGAEIETVERYELVRNWDWTADKREVYAAMDELVKRRESISHRGFVYRWNRFDRSVYREVEHTPAVRQETRPRLDMEGAEVRR